LARPKRRAVLPLLAPKAALLKVGVRALVSRHHPILVHMVPTRRCNLACTYCNEFDSVSPAVPTGEMLERIDRVADLRASLVSFSGGEPLLHPALDRLVARVAHHKMLPEVLTNGLLLTRKRIEALNRAGLLRMQVSVDNVMPDAVSKKSLKSVGGRLELLAERARFDVNVNTVLGAGTDPDAVLEVARFARSLGFSSTVGVVHDGQGQLKALNAQEQAVFKSFDKKTRWPLTRFVRFKENLANGRPNDWLCRAGARYLYICEEGLVHRCSQQRGTPGTPLARYGPADIKREFHTAKPCAPYCTVSCVHAVAVFDNWRRVPQQAGPVSPEPPASTRSDSPT